MTSEIFNKEYHPKLRVALILAVIVVAVYGAGVIAYAILGAQKEIPTSGTSETVEMETYSDSGLTTVLDSIDWGLVGTEQTYYKDIYVKNTGSEPFILSSINFLWDNPSDAGNFTVGHNYISGTVINAGSNLLVVVSLTTGADLTTVPTWSFTIQINAQQYIP